MTRTTRFRMAAGLACPLILAMFATACEVTQQEAECLAELGIEIQQVGDFYFADPRDLVAVWQGGDEDDCLRTGIDYEWSASSTQVVFDRTVGRTVRITPSLRGTVNINLRYGTHSATRQLLINRTEGDIDLQLRGLLTGVNANIDLLGPNNFTRNVTQAGVLMDVPFGSYRYTANNTTGGTPSHKFEPLTLTGNFEVLRNSRHTLSVEYRQTTGQYDFEATNLPAGATGNFGSLTGLGTTYQLTSPRLSLGLDPGTYSATYTQADPAGYQFTPSVSAEQYTIGGGLTVRASIGYTASRGRLEVATTNLPQGATASSTIVGGGMTRTPMLPGGWFYMPGNYTLTAGEAIGVRNTTQNRLEDYRPLQAGHNFTISAGVLSRLTLDYQLKGWKADEDVAWMVKVDMWAHHSHLGGIRVGSMRFDAIAAGSEASLGAASAASALTITGAAPFIPLTGTLNDDGTFSASGTGTVVGYTNVPILFTGTLSAMGVLNGEMKIGSDSAPTGLPNGSITYTITGTRRALAAPSR